MTPALQIMSYELGMQYVTVSDLPLHFFIDVNAATMMPHPPPLMQYSLAQ